MARYKTLAKKLRLGRQAKRTRWAPFWAVPKALGKGKRVHPSRLTRVKRSWRRTKLRNSIPISNKARRFRKIKSGYIRKKY
jgi:ribosomal protein L39E